MSTKKEEKINIEEEDESIEAKVKKIKEKLKKCQKDKEDYLAGWQRARADFINARREEEKRRAEFTKFANELLVSEILVVLDSFDLALENNKEKNLQVIKIQLEGILKKHGLETIKASGEKFNPEFHEAMEEVESKEESGIVVEELQKGYLLHNKVLRPTKVKISR
ncbi:nucleotide exchange factor GrpE [Patescibacteria group bacterium]|nr:nucleotide exchange factor GrpE [Patescibacteria group bacterium]